MSLREATRENFSELVADGVVLVDVWGPSCLPCLALLPHIEALAARRDDLRVVKLEAPKARRLCMELKLMGLPAFLLFRDGEEVGRLSGPDVTAERLDGWIDETLA
ncbi:MAG TPA: thioredoxin family protein [Acidimicrobiia bacterium]|jgi:thioredoxin 1|nr:thioredoxin family protein [Acidimicrobiia bacterium]